MTTGAEAIWCKDTGAWIGLLVVVTEPGNRNVKGLATWSCVDFFPEPSAGGAVVVVWAEDTPGTFSLILAGVFVYLGRACGDGRSDMSWRKWSCDKCKSYAGTREGQPTRRVMASSHIWLCSRLNSRAFENTSSTSLANSSEVAYSLRFNRFCVEVSTSLHARYAKTYENVL